MVTLKEVAAAANVSTVTASSVLSGVNRVRVSPGTAERIHSVAKQMNYVPLAAARGLRTGKTRIIAFVSSAYSRFGAGDAWHESLRGVSDLLWEREERIMLVMSRTREHELEIIRQMAYGRQVDGFIVQNAPGDGERIDLLLRSERPFVVMGGTPRANINSVSFDMRAFAADIAAFLRADDCGAILPLLPHNFDENMFAPFLEYFAQWEREHGIRRLHWKGAFLPGAEWLAGVGKALGGKKLGVALLRSLLPEMMNALQEAGLPPGEASNIVYVSTGEDVFLEPAGLSVMHFDNYTLGRRAARLLMSLVDSPKPSDPPPPQTLIIPAAQRG